MSVHICGLDKAYVLSMFKPDYRVALFCVLSCCDHKVALPEDSTLEDSGSSTVHPDCEHLASSPTIGSLLLFLKVDQRREIRSETF